MKNCDLGISVWIVWVSGLTDRWEEWSDGRWMDQLLCCCSEGIEEVFLKSCLYYVFVDVACSITEYGSF